MVFGRIERSLSLQLAQAFAQTGEQAVTEPKWSLSGAAIRLARDLKRLAVPSGLLARVGNDEQGRRALSLLRREGIQTSSIQRDLAFESALSVDVEAREQNLRFVSAGTPKPVSRNGVSSALKGIRHLHLCEDSVREQPPRLVHFALRNAANIGATTSMELKQDDTLKETDLSPKLLSQITVLFTDSRILRALVKQRRLAHAVDEVMGLGVATIVVDLEAGGCRVYETQSVERIPAFIPTPPRAPDRFVSAYIAGMMLGAPPTVCAIYGQASNSARSKKRVDRAELLSRIRKARSNPHLRKLIDPMRVGEQLLSSRRSKRLLKTL